LFELSFGATLIDVHAYFSCTAVGDGCVYAPSATVWKLMSDAGRGKAALSYAIKGVNAATAGDVSTSPKRSIAFGEEDLLGGVYYWNAKAGTTVRYELGPLGKNAAKASTFISPKTVGAGQCVGCHTLSRDGKRIALGIDVPVPTAVLKVIDAVTKKPFFQQGTMFGGGANFTSFSPDGAQLAVSNGSSITIRDAATGMALVDPLDIIGTMPDWSADGKHIVYARSIADQPCSGDSCGQLAASKAEIVTTTFDGSGWSKAAPLVPYAGKNNFYPAYSPDGKFVMFNRSPSDAASYDAPDAEVWFVAADGGQAVKLARASKSGDSWPRWTTTVQKYRGGSLMWLTFSSRRGVGLRATAKNEAQLWMAAFDPAVAATGKDASYAAFWLPFQDATNGNHIAQWVLEVDHQPCSKPTDCPTGEVCKDGFCAPDVPD
jgi:hypothetical protein